MVIKSTLRKLILGVFFLFIGCGSGDDSSASSLNPNSDNPVFTSPDTIYFTENSTESIVITATDKNDVDFTINGEDRKFFRIYQDENASSATLDFIDPPDYEIKKVYRLTVIADDGFAGNKTIQELTINIQPVDETLVDITPPKFSSVTKTFTIDENKIIIGKVLATDTNRITYYVSGGIDLSSFKIDSSTGVLEFLVAPDYEIKSSYEVKVTAEDKAGNKSVQSIIIKINNVNDTATDTTAPILDVANIIQVYENETYVMRVIATDVNSITYSISGTDANSFTMDTTSGTLQFKVAPDYEARTLYYLDIIATDSKGNSQKKSNVQIQILDVVEPIIDNTAPVFTSSSSVSVNENQMSAITLRATDNNSITYSISGTDASYFNIGSSTGVVTFKSAPDYESKTSYTFTAKATDSKGNSRNQTVNVYIIDVEEVPPKFISSSSVSVGEKQISVLTVKAIDENSITYSISGSDASYFNMNTLTGVVTFKVPLNYEDGSSYNFTVSATDSYGNSASQTIVVTILDVYKSEGNRIPVAIAGADITVKLGEVVTLDASKSLDSDGYISRYTWRELGVLLSNSETFQKNNFTTGIHRITLDVIDDEGYNGTTDTIIVNVSDRKYSNPTLMGSFATKGIPTGLKISIDETKAYIADSGKGFKIIDISNPYKLSLLGSFSYGSIYDIAISKDETKAYLGGYGKFSILDITNKSNPSLIGTYNTGNDLLIGIEVSKDETKAFLANEQKGLQIIDISDLSNPILISTFSTQRAYDVEVSEDETIAYIADYTDEDGLKIINISDVANPFLVSNYNTNYIMNVSLHKNTKRVYVQKNNNCNIIQDTLNPSLHTEINVNCDQKVYFSKDNKKAVFSSRTQGLTILLIEDIFNPIFLGHFNGDISESIVSADGTKVFFVDRINGFRIIKTGE